MAELQEIPLELQVHEANRRIAAHLSKGCKYAEILSPAFLRRFPAMMDGHLSMEWDTILGVFDRMPSFPVTLIDNEVLDEWGAHPTIWEAQPKQWHAWRVLAMVRYTLPTGQNHSPAVVYGATFVFIPSRQVHTTLSDALQFLRFAKEDSVVLVSTPKIPAFSPEPKNGQYMTLLPISGNPDIDRGPLHSLATAILPKASNEGAGPKMAVRVKLLPCFGSSKHSRTEMLTEEALTWEPQRQDHLRSGRQAHMSNNIREVGGRWFQNEIHGPGGFGGALNSGGWEDFHDLAETVNEMANRLMEEDVHSKGTPSPQDDTVSTVMPLLPPGAVMVPTTTFPGGQSAAAS